MCLTKNMFMEKHTSAVSRSCYVHSQNISWIRKLLITTKSLVRSLITSHIDYCNVLLCGVPDTTVKRLQLIKSIVTRTFSYENISSATFIQSRYGSFHGDLRYTLANIASNFFLYITTLDSFQYKSVLNNN